MSVRGAFSSDTRTSCGTQNPLRLRLRLAGRGPNNNSLLPPLAAVIVVAGHSIARPIACGNRVPPQRTVLRETPRTASILHKQKEPHPAGYSSQKREDN